jgi:hypothetical protein
LGIITVLFQGLLLPGPPNFFGDYYCLSFRGLLLPLFQGLFRLPDATHTPAATIEMYVTFEKMSLLAKIEDQLCPARVHCVVYTIHAVQEQVSSFLGKA